MALALLLNSHISVRVARTLRERGFDVVALSEWREGLYLHAPDEDILKAAHEEHRALVSYDLATIPRMLDEFAAAGIEHSGVVHVSSKTIASNDVGGLVRALERLLVDSQTGDLRNQRVFLQR
jgi:predicted nuclease of predicted toxin-antitoxin system